MARKTWRLRRPDNRIIFHATDASISRRLLCPQHSPRCVLVVVDSECCRSISGILEKTIREIRVIIADSLNDMLEELLCVRPEPCTEIRCDGYAYHGKKAAARRTHLLINRMRDSQRRTRLLRHLRNLLKNGSFGEKDAAWHREGPPNNVIFCWMKNCCADAQ